MNLSPLPIQKFFDNNGAPLVNGLLFTYAAGTATKIATAKDQAGTPNTNPIQLDYRGEANVWLDQTLTYKFTLAPAGDTDPPTKPIWTVDNISAALTYVSLTQAIIGQIFYPRTVAEISAGIIPTVYYYEPGNVLRYGAAGDNVTNDTGAIQSAISVAMAGGDPWYVPEHINCVVATTGSTSSPVGAALTISGACSGIIDGQIRAINNCNMISITADNVVLTGRGRIKHYGTFFQAGANNGSCIKNTGSFVKVDGLTMEDPPQYGIFYSSATATGGEITNVRVVGGPTVMTGNQHYGVEAEGPLRGLKILGVQVLPNAAGTGHCVQGLGSGSNGGVPWDCNVSGIDVQQVWDHGTYWYCRGGTFSNVNVSRSGGCGIRIVGDAACAGLGSDDCAGGGIDFLNSGGGSLAGFDIKDYQTIGLAVELLDTPTDDAISSVSIGPGVIKGKAATATVRSGIRVLSTYSGTGTNQRNITLSNVIIQDAAQSGTAEGSIRLEVTAGKTFSRLRVLNCTIDTPGYVGIELVGGGTFVDCDVLNNTVRNPGANAAAAGSDTNGIRLQAATTMTRGRVSGNRCVDDRGGGAKMVNAFSVAGTQSFVEFRHNDAFGFTTAFGSFLQDGDYTPGTTTPSVRNRDSLYIANGGAVTITNFLDGQERQEIQLTFADANTTINRANAILVGGVNYTSAAGGSLRLINRQGVWRECGRTAAAS